MQPPPILLSRLVDLVESSAFGEVRPLGVMPAAEDFVHREKGQLGKLLVVRSFQSLIASRLVGQGNWMRSCPKTDLIRREIAVKADLHFPVVGQKHVVPSPPGAMLTKPLAKTTRRLILSARGMGESQSISQKASGAWRFWNDRKPCFRTCVRAAANRRAWPWASLPSPTQCAV